jgi:hypothetical protein
MNENENQKSERKIKSIIIDSELKEWEEWGNRYFGHNQQNDDLYHKDDLKISKRR